jgi:predicted TIM-barrel fold metal-dependent hydrolase
MIVDSQVHLWAPETPERPWITGGQARAHLPEPLTWQKFLPMMDEAGVDRAIIVPPTWPGDDNDHALEAVHNHPGRFAIMGRLAIERPESRKLLPRWKAQPGMLGIRLAFNHEKTPWIADGTADWVWPAAAAAGVPIMLFAPDAPEAVASIARDYPDLKLIIDHMGLATRGPEKDRIGARIDLIAPLAKYPNVAVKLSAVPGFSHEPYPFRDMTPHLRRLIAAFGPRRAFWGTDLTHQRGKYPYRQYVTHFMEELDFLSESDRTLIMGEAILQFLGWQKPMPM